MVPSGLQREIIYVELLDEGSPTARPAYGLRVDAGSLKGIDNGGPTDMKFT
jgi:hypothetical protein